jgi:hypothetical protein
MTPPFRTSRRDLSGEEKMDSVTNTKYIPNSSDRTAQTSEPKLDARGGQFERQIELLNERKNHLKREIAVLDRQERSADRSKPCSQNRGSDQSGCRSSNERKKILNEEIGALIPSPERFESEASPFVSRPKRCWPPDSKCDSLGSSDSERGPRWSNATRTR